MGIDITIKDMIHAYIEEKMKDDIEYIKNIKYISESKSFEEFLRESLTFFPEHRWFVKLSKDNIKAYRTAFSFLKFNQNNLNRKKSFDEIISFIDDFNIKNFGELSIHDTALAIGIAKNMMPNKVFLHAGPRKALKFILGDEFKRTVKYLKKDRRIQYVELKDMPREFEVFKNSAYLIEICLCYIYSNYIKNKKISNLC